MTRGKSYKKDLVQYRLELARDMLRDAHVLKENGGSPVSVANRAYSSVFYAALALLVTVDTEPNKHSGVLAKFDELFVREGIFPKEMSSHFSSRLLTDSRPSMDTSNPPLLFQSRDKRWTFLVTFAQLSHTGFEIRLRSLEFGQLLKLAQQCCGVIVVSGSGSNLNEIFCFLPSLRFTLRQFLHFS